MNTAKPGDGKMTQTSDGIASNKEYWHEEGRWSGPNIGAWWSINSGKYLVDRGASRLLPVEDTDLSIADSWCVISQFMAADLGLASPVKKQEIKPWSIGRSST